MQTMFFFLFCLLLSRGQCEWLFVLVSDAVDLGNKSISEVGSISIDIPSAGSTPAMARVCTNNSD